MRPVAILFSTFLLTACGETPEEKAHREYHAAAVVVKICRDGTYIWKYPDGKYRTGGMGHPVENPSTVCESR